MATTKENCNCDVEAPQQIKYGYDAEGRQLMVVNPTPQHLIENFKLEPIPEIDLEFINDPLPEPVYDDEFDLEHRVGELPTNNSDLNDDFDDGIGDIYHAGDFEYGATEHLYKTTLRDIMTTIPFLFDSDDYDDGVFAKPDAFIKWLVSDVLNSSNNYVYREYGGKVYLGFAHKYKLEFLYCKLFSSVCESFKMPDPSDNNNIILRPDFDALNRYSDQVFPLDNKIIRIVVSNPHNLSYFYTLRRVFECMLPYEECVIFAVDDESEIEVFVPLSEFRTLNELSAYLTEEIQAHKFLDDVELVSKLSFYNQVLFLSPQEGDSLDPTTSSEAGGAQEIEHTIGVDLVENRGKTLAKPADPLPLNVKLLGNQFEPHIYPSLTSRWNNIGTLSWSTSDTQGSIIDSLDLPLGVYSSLSTNPTYLPFNQYLFFRPNLTLKYQLNSTRFHSGLLVIGIQYYTKVDNADEGLRTPIDQAQVWQLDSVTTFAANSNTIEIDVPFQSPFDMIPIRNGVMGSQAYFATVFTAVVSPLDIGTGGSTSVTITRQVKFECQNEPTIFFCQQTALPPVSSSSLFLEPQGFFDFIGGIADTVKKVAEPLSFIPGVSEVAGIANLTSGVIDKVVKPVEGLFGGIGQAFKASNMDRPIIPLEPSTFVRYPVTSLSNGNGPIPAKSLRVDPAMTSPHHPAQLPTNGTLLDNHQIADKWGYVGSFSVSTSNKLNDIICTIPISPLAQMASVSGNMLLTPIAGVANQYLYWCGSIVFKFKLVKADPHSVRLRISTVPSDPETNGDNLINYFSTVQDFEEVNEVDYVAPYMGATPQLPVSYNGGIVCAGYVQVRMESLLITMPSIADSIELVVLAKAGSDFGLSVPAPILYQPLVKPSDVPPFFASNNSTKSIRVYRNEPSYVTIPFATTKTVKLDGSDSTISLFTIITPGNSFYLPITEGTTQHTYFITADTSDPTANITFDSENADETDPIKALYIFDNTLTETNESFASEGMGSSNWGTRSINVYSTTNWQTKSPTQNLNFSDVPSLLLEPQEEVERELETNTQGPSTTPSGSQLLVHGEDFNLRTCLRRFQYYIDASYHALGLTGNIAFSINLTYGSPGLRGVGYLADNLTWNHDAFRFGKGSLNFNLIINKSNVPDLKIKVFHIPPGLNSFAGYSNGWSSLSTTAAQNMSFYGHEIVADATTSVPFNVPFYNYCKSLVNGIDPSLTSYAATSMFGFGQLVIVMYNVGETDDVDITIERALADDTDLYVFQGWPLTSLTALPTIVNFNSQTQFSPSDLTSLHSNRKSGTRNFNRNKDRLVLSGDVETNPGPTDQDFRLQPQL